jgi:hypothetical protein
VTPSRFLVCTLLLITATPAFAAVTTYPAPKGASLSDDYVVAVDGVPIDVYRGVVREDLNESYGGPFSFTYFDFEKTVEVKIVSRRKPLDRLRIQPLSLGIVARVQANTATFRLGAACRLSFEPDLKRGPLILFANPPEQGAPKENDPGVHYFGAGLHRPGAIELRDNETLYIAGGAVVKGGVHAMGRNISIRGRGILDGLDWPRGKGPTRNILAIDKCSNTSVEGIIVKDGWMWNVNITGSDNVHFRNVKVIASRCANNDGIDVCNSQHVTVEDSFIRTDDDCIAPKGMDSQGRKPVDDLQVSRCILWTDLANVWRIGCESRAEAMRNMLFSDIDVIHFADSWPEQPFGVDLITLQPGEDMPMENIRFENIRVYYAKEPLRFHGECRNLAVGTGSGQKTLIEVRPQWTVWAKNKAPGKWIRDVLFRNINIFGEDESRYGIIHVSAPDANHPVEGVVFENVIRGGELLTRSSSGVQVMGQVKDISFRSSPDAAAVPRIVPAQTEIARSPVTVEIECSTQGAQIRYTLDGSNPIPSSPLYSGPLRISRPCVIKAVAFHKGLKPSLLSVSEVFGPRKPPSGVAAGLTYSYYEKAHTDGADEVSDPLGGGPYRVRIPADLWTDVSQIGCAQPLKTGTASSIDAGVIESEVPFGLSFSGSIEIAADGIYEFQLSTDTGARLFVGESQVLYCGTGRPLSGKASIALQAGRHPIKLDYIHNPGSKILKFGVGPR